MPWFLPRSAHTTVCDPWQQRQFYRALDRDHNTTAPGCDCLADCEYTEYSVKTTKAEFR